MVNEINVKILILILRTREHERVSNLNQMRSLFHKLREETKRYRMSTIVKFPIKRKYGE